MAELTYDKEITALVVIDPYNDFISEGAKFFPDSHEYAKGAAG